jgi:hypothetical protein
MNPLENVESIRRFYKEQERYFKNGDYLKGISILKPLIDKAIKEKNTDTNILIVLARLAIDYSQYTKSNFPCK